jgi:hypothetical protein
VNCLSLCTEKRAKCTDSDEVTSCLSCVSDCATDLDGSMLDCLQAIDPQDKEVSYGVDLDSCMSTASDVMEDCKSACIGT